MNRWNTQEIDNAKSENEAWRFGQGRCDGVGDTARRCDDHDHFGAIDGEPGHSEKDRPAMCKMPHGAAYAE
jgi:hypothetical protein